MSGYRCLLVCLNDAVQLTIFSLVFAYLRPAHAILTSVTVAAYLLIYTIFPFQNLENLTASAGSLSVWLLAVLRLRLVSVYIIGFVATLFAFCLASYAANFPASCGTVVCFGPGITSQLPATHGSIEKASRQVTNRSKTVEYM